MLIIGFVQWLIDTVGKLGPLSVAVAVYLANKRQNAWASGATVRAANLEDQKMRLALLDRRLTVINHLRVARDKTGFAMTGMDALGAVLEALREAELVFENEERAAINGLLNRVINFQSKFGMNRDLDGDQLMLAAAEYQSFTSEIARVVNLLSETTRIKVLAPLNPPL
jgi:hypothetical protein